MPGDKWSDGEKEILRQCILQDMSFSDIAALLPSRSSNSVELFYRRALKSGELPSRPTAPPSPSSASQNTVVNQSCRDNSNNNNMNRATTEHRYTETDDVHLCMVYARAVEAAPDRTHGDPDFWKVQIQPHFPGRTAMSLKLRYRRLTQLDPSLPWATKVRLFTEAEDDELVVCRVRGERFSSIATRIPGRTVSALTARYGYLTRGDRAPQLNPGDEDGGGDDGGGYRKRGASAKT